MNKVKQLKTTLFKHPKKSVLFAIIFGLAIAYKTGNVLLTKLFSKVLSSMNQKFLLQMNEQFSNVEKYNRKLANLELVTTNFEQSKLGKTILSQIFRSSVEIQNLRFEIKNISKEDQTKIQLRSDKFQQLNNSLITQTLQTICLYKPFYVLTYITEVIFINEKDSLYTLLDKDNMIILALLQNLNQILLESTYEEFTNQLLKKINLSEDFKYTKIYSLNDYYALICKLAYECKIIINREKIENQINQLVQEKFAAQQFIAVQQPDEESKQIVAEGIRKAKQKCFELIRQYLYLSECESVKSYAYFSFQFQLRKLWNRFLIFIQKSGPIKDQVLFAHLSNTNKIIQDEFLGPDSDQQNYAYYQNKLKATFKYAVDPKNQEQISESQLSFLYKINEERGQCDLLNQTINQLARKVMFGEEIDQKEDYGSDEKSNLADLLLQFAQ